MRRQTRPADTVILVLDCPPEPTLYRAILAREEWLESVWLRENVGPAEARNRGMKSALARGCEWVTFLDEDDLLHPRYLERMLQSSEWCPWASIHYCDWVWCGDRAGHTRVPEYSYERLCAGPYIMSTSLIKTQVWLDVREKNGTGFDPALRGWEDYLFYLEAGALGHEGARVGLALVKYRRHGGYSISDETHAHLPRTVRYIRDKMQTLYGVRVTYQCLSDRRLN